MDDPIHFLVRKYGWCGVLLEPDPQFFERLKENYSGVDGPILVNAALSPINGKTTFYRIRMDEKMPSWCAGLGSFRRDVILSTKSDVPEIESHIVEDRIESISFHSLVARYKLPRIDLIVIDTEGYDLEILRQLDLIRFSSLRKNLETEPLFSDESRGFGGGSSFGPFDRPWTMPRPVWGCGSDCRRSS